MYFDQKGFNLNYLNNTSMKNSFDSNGSNSNNKKDTTKRNY